MLTEIGLDSVDQLFSGIPEALRLKRLLNIPKALTEPELVEYFRERATKDAIGTSAFIGAGIYHHNLPIVIISLILSSKFYTSYTTYQAKISQGNLQDIL